MDEDQRDRVWHADSEGRAEAQERDKKSKFNWLPLLILPVAFFLGWGANEALSSADEANRVSENRPEVGVGGGPENTTCPSPEAGG
jgi:hypothetical protein